MLIQQPARCALCAAIGTVVVHGTALCLISQRPPRCASTHIRILPVPQIHIKPGLPKRKPHAAVRLGQRALAAPLARPAIAHGAGVEATSRRVGVASGGQEGPPEPARRIAQVPQHFTRVTRSWVTGAAAAAVVAAAAATADFTALPRRLCAAAMAASSWDNPKVERHPRAGLFVF